MRVASTSSFWLVFVSFCVALILEVLPLPRQYMQSRPDFFYLVIIYWAIYSPLKLGLGFAFFPGLLLDVLRGSLLGVHSLIMVVLLLLMHVFCQRMRMFTVWKQSSIVFLMLTMAGIIQDFLISFSVDFSSVLLSALISATFWPILILILSKLDKDPNAFYYL